VRGPQGVVAIGGRGGLNGRLKALADAVAGLTGWRRRLTAFFAGVAAALAFAPLYVLPLLAVAFSVFVLLIDGARSRARPGRSAFAAGWFFGFGFFITSLYWLAFSFFVQAEQFAWMAPIAVTGLPAFLALFTGAAAALSGTLWRLGWRRILLFAAVFMTFEYARGHVLTGLPWNLPGQALAGTAIGAQTAAWWGVYGLSLLVVLLAAAPALARDGKGAEGIFLMLAGLLALYAIGGMRLMGPGPGVHENVFVRIVQPNIPQREKIDGELWTRNYERHIELSKGETEGRLYVIWPENAAPYMQELDGALTLIAEKLPRNAVLLAGTVRRETQERELYFNSIGLFAREGGTYAPKGYYDKHHLAPFGEYLPFQGALRAIGLAQLAPYDDGFAFGSGPKVMSDGGPPFSPLICYETIFPGKIVPKGSRPDWLVTVTNDAWFGDSAGPRQHLDQARLRAIELGLPMARSANTGISALIDARGRLLDRVPLYRQGVVTAPLPKPMPSTLYNLLGDLPFALLVIGVIILAATPAGRAREGR
jgi:apolipoprotein N-acyltransferase